jgi:hypothetical protein
MHLPQLVIAHGVELGAEAVYVGVLVCSGVKRLAGIYSSSSSSSSS